VKTPKSYKFSDLTLARIADIESWLPAESATHAVEEAVADFHKRLLRARELGDMQAELADLWARFEQQHPNYDVYATGDTEVIYNAKERARWPGRGIFDFTVLERQNGIYKTAYNVHRLKEMASTERWFVP
jgi:plasmid stabilization system protein ParE